MQVDIAAKKLFGYMDTVVLDSQHEGSGSSVLQVYKVTITHEYWCFAERAREKPQWKKIWDPAGIQLGFEPKTFSILVRRS